jgi:hypothetical protein
MTTWEEVERAVPEFAQRVRALFDAHRHKTIATLRADGSPRISGIEAAFEGAAAQWPGEAKIAGRALAAGSTTAAADGDRFRADIAGVVHTHLNAEATLLVVEWWTPAHGLRRIERE